MSGNIGVIAGWTDYAHLVGRQQPDGGSGELAGKGRAVIASEAKQSRVVGGALDCFVASLLAMTAEGEEIV